MKQFKLLNNVVGWLVFSLFASGPEQVAYWINVMSALLSAFCILFLFWSITHLTRKLLCTDGVVETLGQTLTILASGVAGALAYTWSDTFWFSAVEGEVYAYSSMFTALVFWLILKWEDNADSPHADRWIVLIFYLTGLSIGVHLLNLLCLPAIVLVYYYKKTPDANLKGSLMALGLSVVLVAAVLYGVVPGIVKVGGWFELFFVNVLGLPFNSGMIIYILVLIGVVSAALWSTLQSNRVRTVALYLASVGMLGIPFYGKGYVTPLLLGAVVLCALWFLLQWKKNGQYVVRKRALNTSLLCMLMLMIGYSSYALIVLRSAQNTPMDQNSPEDIFSLGTYLNREQYGQKPLLYGQAFTSQAVGYGKEESVQRHEKKNANEPDKYDIVEVSGQPVYPSAQKMLFPRMFSRLHAGLYQQWLGGVDTKPVEVRGQYEGQAYDFTGEMPSQWDNLRFFLSYQVNFMYWRYFMWNFAGRQNDVQSYGELDHGQPLLLGLLGMFWQAYRGKKGIQQFWVVFFLFFMTGLAIILYLNQTPSEPRERDYAYAGSFYAFAIWIGLGIAALVEGLRRFGKLPHLAAAGIASVVALAVPLQMVSQTWDDHDRSGRTAARDFGMNYLYSLDEKGNPVIFTNGDNDTFPLWYGQDVEGERTDARVCNLSYLQTDWYIDQMRRPAWKSPSLPITWKRWEYVDNMGHDAFMVRPELKEQLLVLKKDFQAQGKKDDPFELQYIIDNFVRNPEIACVPTDSIVLTVDKAAVLRSGMKLPHGKDSIPEKMHISLRGKRMLTKSEMMVYEMLAHHNWTRPLYMSTTLGGDNQAGLDNYLMLEGLAARITPFNVGSGGTDSERMYDNFMRKFRYGNVADPKVYVDQTVMRPCYTHRLRMAQLAQQLLMEGKRDKALKVLQKCEQVLPPNQVPYEVWSLGIDTKKDLLMMPECYRELGKTKEAEAILKSVADRALAYFDWYNSFSENRLSSMSNDIMQQYQILGMAIDGLQVCKSSLIENYKKRADVLAGTPAGRVLISAMNARRAADAQRSLPSDAEEGAEY